MHTRSFELIVIKMFNYILTFSLLSVYVLMYDYISFVLIWTLNFNMIINRFIPSDLNCFHLLSPVSIRSPVYEELKIGQYQYNIFQFDVL